VKEDRLVSDRPFSVLGVQQIAVGGPDKAALRRLWVETLGLVPTGTFRSESENVDEDICVAGGGPFKVEVDLMQPIDPDKVRRCTTATQPHRLVDRRPGARRLVTTQGALAPGGSAGRGRLRRVFHPRRATRRYDRRRGC
jgi:lactoylglutathione lyase